MLKVIKIAVWTLVVLFVLIIGSVIGVSLWLTPERITALIEKEASQFLDADLKIGSLEYKFWKTFPWLCIEVDSIQIESRSLDNLPQQERDKLPANANDLVKLLKFKGEVNIRKLFHDELAIRGIYVEKPWVNIVVADSGKNNFLIFPKDMPEMKLKLKDFEIGELKIVGPVDLSFFSLPDDTEVKSKVSEFYITEQGKKKFGLGFEGTVDGRYGEISVPGVIPVKMDLTATVSLPDIALRLEDLKMKVAEVAVEANGKIEVDKEKLTVEKMDLNVNVSDVFSLINSLPAQISDKIPLPVGLTGELPVNAMVRLLDEYTLRYDRIDDIRLNDLPSVKVNLTVDEAWLRFSHPGQKPVFADDIYILANSVFNPKDSMSLNLDLPRLRLYGEGVKIDSWLKVDNILGDIQPFFGVLNFDSNLLKTLSYFMPGIAIKLDGHLKGNTEFEGYAVNLGKGGVKKISINGNVSSKSIQVNSGKTSQNFYANNITTNYDVTLPTFPAKNYKGAEVDLSFDGEQINITSGKEDLISLSGIKIEVDKETKGFANPEGLLKLGLDTVKFQQNGISFDGVGLNLTAEMGMQSRSDVTPKEYRLPESENEKLIASEIPHTPLYLQFSDEWMIRKLSDLLKINSDLTLSRGVFSMPSYLYPFEIDRLTLTTDLNTVGFKADDVRIDDSAFQVSGIVSGIKDFITAGYPTLLTADAEIGFNNVDINNLSWGYYGAMIKEGNDSVWYLPAVLPLTAADSVCVALPRNLEANIRLRSDSAEYMQYKFSPLQTQILLKDGNAVLKNLNIGTPYCDVSLDWTYSTRNLDDIFMRLNVGLDNFRFSPFYTVFPSLADKVPELKNFTGNISADIDCKFLMYPTMFITAPSIAAKFDIKGSDLQFARHGKIERITHLMLIEGDAPIKLSNIDITGGFHDNLLQVDPFKIEFDDYCLGVAGINNMQGDMYYQLSLEKSPIHIPFSVSIVGKMKHPEIRLGGTSINEKRSEIVAGGIEWQPDINIMAYLKNGWQMFLQEAAKYQQKISDGK